ncbi:MAG TPA: hydrogenase formation protein HypD [Chitinophagaceae bacterium]|jgi:hydrogenase expression/formation protein HypD|nr:hydrogenase formation protein HypD [Chitinophagaceae bacterium]HMU57936.1 hydrogenase formation protein HypD [Chitinophagaceae bacterium]
MKYLSEYRDPELVKQYLEEIHKITTRPWKIMEICGGQTHGLVKNGIIDMLPEKITMVHGPGCPVCVTPVSIIDEAVYLAKKPNVIICSFGDMLRVPGSQKSLLEAKAEGADVRILYSPLEAVQLAQENPEKEVVFFAVGFETTAPANALSIVHADKTDTRNYSILASHVLVPPAMEAILGDEENQIDAFLAAGHVCTIMGMEEYYPVVEKYKTPVVITGFEPVDLLQGILMAVQQLEKGEYKLENQYTRYVQREGNRMAKQTMEEVFDVSDRMWRGIGTIPQSGYEVNEKYRQYNSRVKFNLDLPVAPENPECISGDIMKGLKKPVQCPNFGTKCKPEHPLGAPMVSSEGACAAYYHYSDKK